MKKIRYAASILLCLLASTLGVLVVAPAAFAVRLAPPDGTGPATVSARAGVGMPGWQIVLIAVAAAFVAAALTAVTMRLRFHASPHAATA